MKALKSELAKSVLADPAAARQLRQYLVTKGEAANRPGAGVYIDLKTGSGIVRLKPRVVPKAA